VRARPLRNCRRGAARKNCCHHPSLHTSAVGRPALSTMANLQGFAANPDREDEYLLPAATADPWVWEPDPSERVFVIKDSAQAAINAAKRVWSDADVLETTCFAHASSIWLKKSDNRALFRDKENVSICQADLNTLKICPFIHIVEPLKQAMLTKWRRAPVSERNVAEQWGSFWSSKRLTMVEANEDNPLGGGMATDNNTLERINGTDKNGFLPCFWPKILRDVCSFNPLMMCGSMVK